MGWLSESCLCDLAACPFAFFGPTEGDIALDDSLKSPPINIGPDNPATQDGNAPSELESVAANSPPPFSHGKNDLFPHFTIIWLALNLIQSAPRRVRRASETQIKGVIQSITAYGFWIPILVRTRPDGTGYEVIDGHARLEAAKRLCADEVPCVAVDDLSDVEIRRMRLSLNKLQETGEWDPEVLKIEIGEIIEITGEIEIPGFAMPEIETLRFGVGSDEADPADDMSGLAVEILGRPASRDSVGRGMERNSGRNSAFCGNVHDYGYSVHHDIDRRCNGIVPDGRIINSGG